MAGDAGEPGAELGDWAGAELSLCQTQHITTVLSAVPVHSLRCRRQLLGPWLGTPQCWGRAWRSASPPVGCLWVVSFITNQ